MVVTASLPRLSRLSGCLLISWMAVLLSGLGVVYVSHQCRLLYGELAQLQQEKNRLEIARGQNLLEASAQASLHRVEQLALGRLDMQVPALDEIIRVKP
ncbi:MAG: cell division protein FtsL [Gammaproteobacteria bacterium]|nr:MAG: cell division protein FtsL [Gammaproteobacteria bacterium]